VIKSFKDGDTQLLWETGKSRRIPASLRTAALKKLAILHWATSLESLTGDRKGQHSIRINDQYRLCFMWHDGDASGVEIVDYH
jgi:toxin HigB-1